MKKSIKYTVSAAVLATMMIQAAPAFATPVTSPVTKGQIDATKEQIGDFETKIQQLDNRISNSMENSQKLNEQINQQQGMIKETELELEKAKTALENHKKIYSERLKSIQLKGNQSVITYAEVLLNSNSISEFFNRFTAISQFIKSDTDLLNGLNEKEKELKDTEVKLHSQVDQLKKSQVELASEQKKIEEDKKLILQELATAKDTLQTQQAQLAQQEAARQAQLAQQAPQKSPQKAAASTTSTSKPSIAAVNVTSSATADNIIAIAKQYLGVPYVWGGSTPSGFDCSGFVGYVYRQVGISLPRTSRDQQKVGQRIPLNQVQPGDLVFRGNPAYHVGIYIGGGQYIHAPQTGDVVKIASFNPSSFSSASRVIR